MKKALFISLVSSTLLFSSVSSASQTFEFTCGNGEEFKVAYPDNDTAIMEYHDELLLLKSAEAASGARYIGEGWEWWTKGADKGMLSVLVGEEDYASTPGIDCTPDTFRTGAVSQ